MIHGHRNDLSGHREAFRKNLVQLSRLCFQSGGVDPSNTVTVTGDYSVFAWNDLGMHCLNPTYDKAVILPPYNNLMVQVIKRGSKPQVVTSGITVSYRIIDNTASYTKRSYGGFWDNVKILFGMTLAHDVGLKGNGLSGNMKVTDNYFIAEGIPVVPVDDNNTWNPYQVAEVTVKDGSEQLWEQQGQQCRHQMRSIVLNVTVPLQRLLIIFLRNMMLLKGHR